MVAFSKFQKNDFAQAYAAIETPLIETLDPDDRLTVLKAVLTRPNRQSELVGFIKDVAKIILGDTGATHDFIHTVTNETIDWNGGAGAIGGKDRFVSTTLFAKAMIVIRQKANAKPEFIWGNYADASQMANTRMHVVRDDSRSRSNSPVRQGVLAMRTPSPDRRGFSLELANGQIVGGPHVTCVRRFIAASAAIDTMAGAMASSRQQAATYGVALPTYIGFGSGAHLQMPALPNGWNIHAAPFIPGLGR